MLHLASSRSLSYFPPTTFSSSNRFIARVAILDALRRPGERDSCGEIELNLEMNIESNELSTSRHLPSHPLNLLHLVGVPKPLRFTLAFLRPCLLVRLTRFTFYLFAFQFESTLT